MTLNAPTQQNMDERTDEELEIVFDLGSSKVHLTRYKSINLLERDDFKKKYFSFKTLASKLDIDLPDQPPEETTSKDEIDQFYTNQVTRVENHLKQYKDAYIEKIFSMGYDVEELLNSLKQVLGKHDSLLNQNVERLQKLAKKNKLRAELLGIDISEEMSTVNDHKKLDEDDVNILELKLKTKLCKRMSEPTQKVMNTRRSEIDPTRIITDDYWAISLIRVPNSSNDFNNASLVLEGIQGKKSMIFFAIFVTFDAFNLLCPILRHDKVKLEYYELGEEGDSSGKQRFQCDEKLMDIRKGDRWLHETWHITKGTAQKLIQSLQCIGEWKKKPPETNILGDSELAVGSAISSSNPTGQNCLTFAKIMLLDLKDENIEIPERKLEEWICLITSRHYEWFPLIFTFLAGAVIIYSFL